MKSAGPHKKTGPAEAAAEPRRFQDSFGSNPLAPEDVDELDLCHLWWRQVMVAGDAFPRPPLYEVKS